MKNQLKELKGKYFSLKVTEDNYKAALSDLEKAGFILDNDWNEFFLEDRDVKGEIFIVAYSHSVCELHNHPGVDKPIIIEYQAS